MSRIERTLSETFGLDPDISDVTPKNELSVRASDASVTEELDDIDSDAIFIKDNLKSLITKGENAFEVLADIAKSEESPRSFEVLNSMLTTLSDLSMQLMTLHEKRAKIKSAKKEEKQTLSVNNNTQTNTTNIAFVGTTTELQEMMKQRRLDALKLSGSE